MHTRRPGRRASLDRTLIPRETIIERDDLLDASVPKCLEDVGIFLLSEWDVLAFVYRHGASLTGVEEIVRLIGYDQAVVVAALERLEHGKLIERSPPSRGVRFYRILASTDAARERCVQHLMNLWDTRSGRLLLTRRLRQAGRASGPAGQSAESAKRG